MAPIFAPPTQTPGRPATRSASMPKPARARISVSSRRADVVAGAEAAASQVEDRVADELAGAVEGDVAAAVALDDSAPRGAGLGVDEEVLVAGATPEGVDGRVLQEGQRLGVGRRGRAAAVSTCQRQAARSRRGRWRMRRTDRCGTLVVGVRKLSTQLYHGRDWRLGLSRTGLSGCAHHERDYRLAHDE